MSMSPTRRHGRWAPTATVLLSILLAATGALAQTVKPRVPPGLDPGGVAVAVADPVGVHYTWPQILARLARDGEGDVIGWDFVDGGQRPYADPGAARTSATSLASIVLRETPAARIVPFRTKAETVAIGRLMVFAAKSPAKVLLLLTATDSAADWAAFAEAAAHFKHVLVVVPVGGDLMGGPHRAFPAQLSAETMLAVTDSDPAPGDAPRPAVADLAVPARIGHRIFDGDAFISGPHVAAARIAALAARMVARESRLEGAALKARILSLAKPVSSPNDKAVRYGWIAAPEKH